MKPLLLLAAASAILLSGCSAVGRAVGVVARPVGGLLRAVTGPVRGLNN